MSLRNIEAVQSSAEIIQKTSTFLTKHTSKQHLGPLIESVIEDANEHQGASVNLTIVSPNASDNGVEMEEARFNGFIRNEDGKWEIDFSLEPEGIYCPVPVEYVFVQ